MAEHPINGMMNTTLQKIKELVDASTVVGEPIISGTTTIIPISKISYGFASGGSDLPTKKTGDFFGGGGGAGASVTPVGFIVISDGDVKLLQVDEHRDSAGKIIDMVPGLIDKVKDSLSKKEGKGSDEDDLAPLNADGEIIDRADTGGRINPRSGRRKK